jgi:hypothetical protein
MRPALILALLALAACSNPDPGPAALLPGTASARCVNPASGAAWTLTLDAAHGLADGHPAKFDSDRIRWTDPADGAAYELAPKTGDLTITRASSTGGYILSARCRAN